MWKFGYQWVPVIGQKIFWGTDVYWVPARENFWVPMGTGYRLNFQLCRSLDIALIFKYLTVLRTQ